ncbi:hypothetical protein MSAN_01355100 [Mycena sanguinolenta]|uniref:Endonuclease/exonuclease/phosphatase domain-containing protein n=1 Tax=Mycena sanguinolenta TaxID=230812 RepID=A0A8H6YEB8_9AGAR|nr:hypothetical protein MSAN_01355100 [Mycena sanguinolenta]
MMWPPPTWKSTSRPACCPQPRGERVAAHRVRTDENELRIGTHIVAILRRIEQLEKKSSAQFSELLMRIEDNARNTGSQTTSITSPAISADMDCLKDMVIEGRAAITSLTEAVNGLVDLPRDVSRLSRTVQALSFAEKPATKGLAIHPNGAASKDMALASKDIVPYSIARTTPSPAEQDDEIFPGFDVRGRSSAHESSTSGSKRSNAFAGFDVRPNNKKSKTHDDEPTHTDVYLWEVNLEVSPMATAHHSMAQLNMAEYIPNIMSVACPRNTKNLISIRFRALAIAELFVERLRSNPPKSMEKLEAVKRDSYEKKGKAKDKGTGPCLRITAWNIHGRLAVKITEPDIVRLIEDNDVVIFQETFLRVGEERTLDLPRGFEVIAMSRSDLPGLRAAGAEWRRLFVPGFRTLSCRTCALPT